MKEILKKAWAYSLYRDGENFALSVLCGKVGLFEINIVLSEEEKAEFYSQGEPYVEELAKAIQSSPSQFANRHEKDLSFD